MLRSNINRRIENHRRARTIETGVAAPQITFELRASAVERANSAYNGKPS
jgi:hypothetical protein